MFFRFMIVVYYLIIFIATLTLCRPIEIDDRQQMIDHSRSCPKTSFNSLVDYLYRYSELFVYESISSSTDSVSLSSSSLSDDQQQQQLIETDVESSVDNLSSNSNSLCTFCRVVLPVCRTLIEHNKTALFVDVATLICEELKITTKSICSQAISLFQNSVFAVIRDTQLNDKELCSLALGCSIIDKNPLVNWSISLPDVPKPPLVPNKLLPPGLPTTRVLQISDIHIDFEYTPGSLVDCDQPLCCRNNSQSNDKKKQAKGRKAGYWGSPGKCDVPIWTVERMFEFISKYEKFDYILWTGDVPSHNVWAQTKSGQINSLKILTDLFKKYFPDKKIYPTIGNHESAPVNLFPTPNIKEDNISWLYEELASDWIKTGLPSQLNSDITNGAFYTLQIAPGLRLISLNMNYCPPENFWLYINSTDPLGQLSWLANTLQISENINEKVHIIGHIPNSACLESWSENYYRIVNRYEATIVGQFFGHTHFDEMELFYNLNSSESTTQSAPPRRPVNLAYLTSSVTTFVDMNPSYRIYIVDGPYVNSTWQVLDYEHYYMNLSDYYPNKPTTATEEQPIWKLEYAAKSAYNLSGLFATDWSNAVDQAVRNLNGTLADGFIKHYYSSSSDLYGACNRNCRKEILCKFKQAKSKFLDDKCLKQ